ncbi:MAG: 5-(carboxyamino)imidazole ribonucleotide synthase [Bacteroidota bacterium]
MIKAGILGGGQLGRMLLQEAINFPVETFVLENDAQCPAAHLCHHFIKGDIRDYDTVLAFGALVDVITIEIESVNTDALELLEKQGKTVIPSPRILKLIKNKIRQKQFYKEMEIPSPVFEVTASLGDLQQHRSFLPAVHKIAEGGYDGRGVQVMESEIDFGKGFNHPAVLEKKVNIAKEIAIIVAADAKGKLAIYPPVEMIVDPYLNLLDYQLSPAHIEEKIKWKAEAIAIKLVKAFESPGVFAIEMLIDRNNEVWVNETAPRVHNSGHHTIEAHFSSQYNMLWRIMLGYPLGNTGAIMPSALINLVGEKEHTGEAYYEGLETVLQMEEAYVHVYGKSETKPGRKMGHVTVLGKDRLDLVHKAKLVKEKMKVVTKKAIF